MDIKSKVLLILLSFLVIVSISASYYKYLVLRDYVIEVSVDCDPSTETCFTYLCDPAFEECTGNPDEETWYYKILFRNAYNFPNCDVDTDPECNLYSCPDGELGCEELLCTDEALTELGLEGEVCTNPGDFMDTEFISNTNETTLEITSDEEIPEQSTSDLTSETTEMDSEQEIQDAQ
jgi:hypothetical protein